MRLLIIEDNLELVLVMKASLETVGFKVDYSTMGIEGEEKAYVNKYDAILLDLNLPDKDGFDILTFLRTNEVITPVMIITARDEVRNRSKGLDMGADDYIIKPFSITELISRIHAVIRRFHGRTNPELQIEKLIINPMERKVFISNTSINLSTKEFDILLCIAQRSPAIVSSEEIAEHVYDEDFDPFSSVLRVHLVNLRKKLKAGGGADILKTVKGKGYTI